MSYFDGAISAWFVTRGLSHFLDAICYLKAANEAIRSPIFAFFLRRLDVLSLDQCKDLRDFILSSSHLGGDPPTQADEDREITFGGYRPERLEGDVTWLPVTSLALFHWSGHIER